ncbi:MAG: type II toxin-antitoxin system VapC family toxin [Candidatus Manganitrophaceae bacterium]
MVEVVIDASILSALFLNEEGAEAIREAVQSETLFHAPSFWRFEVSNAVWKRKEIPLPSAKHLIEIIWNFPIRTGESAELASEGLSLSRKHGITFYDSFYLAMAKRMAIPLWTADRVQARSAIQEGISLWK